MEWEQEVIAAAAAAAAELSPLRSPPLQGVQTPRKPLPGDVCALFSQISCKIQPVSLLFLGVL